MEKSRAEIEKYLNQVIKGDCLEVMPNFPNISVDMILCDLPYGTTQNKWDSVIDLKKDRKYIGIEKNEDVLLHKVQPKDLTGER